MEKVGIAFLFVVKSNGQKQNEFGVGAPEEKESYVHEWNNLFGCEVYIVTEAIDLSFLNRREIRTIELQPESRLTQVVQKQKRPRPK